MHVRVFVQLKDGVLDPQGKAVETSLHHLGYTEAEHVRVGKLIELDWNGPWNESAQTRVKELCGKLLANTVIEKFHFTTDS